MQKQTSDIQTILIDNTFKKIPDNIQAMSSITNDQQQTIISLAFHTSRDIISDIGYQLPSGSQCCPPELETCTALLCSLAHKKAIMAAGLLTIEDIFHHLYKDGQPEETMYGYAAMAILLLKDCLSSYADFKKADLAQWKKENQSSPVIA